MTKGAEEFVAFSCEALAKAKEAKANAEKKIKELEVNIKTALAAENVVSVTTGDWTVEIVKTASTKIVDTAKLKQDGLFEKYSKDRAGFEQVKLSNPNNEFLSGLEERRKKHIEESKSK